MSLDPENEEARLERLIGEVLEAYPEKFAKRRKKHLTVAKAVAKEAEADRR